MRLAGNQVDGAGRRGAERCAIRVVTHGEVLRIVPQSCYGIAVEVAHDIVLVACNGAVGGGIVGSGEFDKEA